MLSICFTFQPSLYRHLCDSSQVRWYRGMPFCMAIRSSVHSNRTVLRAPHDDLTCYVVWSPLLVFFYRKFFPRLGLGAFILRILQVVVWRLLSALAARPAVRLTLFCAICRLISARSYLRIMVLLMTIVSSPYWRLFSSYVIIFVYLVAELIIKPWRLRSVQIFSYVSYFLLLFAMSILFRPACKELSEPVVIAFGFWLLSDMMFQFM